MALVLGPIRHLLGRSPNSRAHTALARAHGFANRTDKTTPRTFAKPSCAYRNHKKTDTKGCLFFQQYYYFTGTTDPPHSLRMKSWISLDFNASTKAFISLLSSSPEFTAMIFTYGDSSDSSIAIESSNGLRSASFV